MDGRIHEPIPGRYSAYRHDAAMERSQWCLRGADRRASSAWCSLSVRGDMMRSLADVDSFGGTDADNDDLLLRAFEDHEAYQDVLSFKRHMIIGKKGSGKTAIFKKLITTHQPD